MKTFQLTLTVIYIVTQLTLFTFVAITILQS